MPGTHITDQQARRFMHLRKSHDRPTAAAMAGFGTTTGARLEADPRLPSQRIAPRGRRRPDPLAAVWEAEVVPMLQAAPGLRPVTILTELCRRDPNFSPDVRRTSGKRYMGPSGR